MAVVVPFVVYMTSFGGDSDLKMDLMLKFFKYLPYLVVAIFIIPAFQMIISPNKIVRFVTVFLVPICIFAFIMTKFGSCQMINAFGEGGCSSISITDIPKYSNMLILTIFPLMFGLFGYMFYFFWKVNIKRDGVLKSGIAGKAVVLKSEDVNFKINDTPVLKLTLKVNMPGRSPYDVTKQFLVPQIVLHEVGAGKEVAVKVGFKKSKEGVCQ